MTDIPGAKHRLTNRHGIKMNVWVDGPLESGAPVVFLMHGFSGNIKQPHMRAMAAAFRANGYITVGIDATNSFNSSGGDIEHANLTRHTADLEDAIAWAAAQPWFRKPFALAGHSMGGGAVLSYAVQNPGRVSMVAPAATLVSGGLYIAAMEKHSPAMLKEWREKGYLSIHFNGKTHKRRWDVTMDGYGTVDIVRDAHRLTMPVMLAAGEKDTVTPPWTIRALYDALPGPRKFAVVPGAPHGFDGCEAALGTLLTAWIREQDEKTLRQNRRSFDIG